GDLSRDPTNLTYAQASNLHGSNTFTFNVHDGVQFRHPATVTISVLSANDPPIAAAGVDQTVGEGALATLDGSASSDPDGDTLKFAWTPTAGTAPVTLTNESTSKPRFSAPL